MAYSDKVIDHYENPRNVGKFDAEDPSIGTGMVGFISYILAATLDPEDLPGFEEFSYTGFTVMTFALMPVTVDGTTTYTPVQLSA